MQRKAYQLKAGNLKNMTVVTENLPEPAADEVTVAVESIGLNFADIFAIWGLYSATPKGTFVPGLEYSGTIAKVGKNVTNRKVGDKIMGVTRFGAYATHLNIDQRYVIPLPEGWDYDTGAAYLVQGLTAYYALTHLGNLQEGHTVLIHSGAGGVGILANRIAKQYGAYTIGTTGSPKKVEFMLEEGYDAAIVRADDFKKQLEEKLSGRELNLVMECIGGKILKIGYEALAPMGRMVVYGSARYGSTGNRPNYLKLAWKFLTRPKIDPQLMTELNKGLLGFNLIHLYERAPIMHQLLSEMEELDIEKPHVGHRFSFEDLPEAIRLFQTGKTIGKIVINV